MDRAMFMGRVNNAPRTGTRQGGFVDLDYGLDEGSDFPYVVGMSKSARADAAKDGPPFEDALKKLEGIVEGMETEDLPLETLLARYEEGTRLVKICQEKLADAELKIRQLEKDTGGTMNLKPFAGKGIEE